MALFTDRKTLNFNLTEETLASKEQHGRAYYLQVRWTLKQIIMLITV